MPNTLASSFILYKIHVAPINMNVFTPNATNKANHLLLFLFKVKTDATAETNKDIKIIIKFKHTPPYSVLISSTYFRISSGFLKRFYHEITILIQIRLCYALIRI